MKPITKYISSLAFIILQFSLFNFLQAQTFYQTVRGIVIDADSKSPLELAGIKIMNLDTNISAMTDADGKFRLLKVPVGRHTIKFAVVGYEDVLLQNIIVTTGKEVVLNVEMQEKIIVGTEVEILAIKDKTKANNDLVTNSSRNFQREETERYAGSRGDPSKMVANYAGVATGNDARNDIIVRGNSPIGVLWRLENTDIPNPNHFSSQGSTGGPVSILNNNLLGSSDFLTGAFPAEYGDKMAAVFDLKLRNGNNEKAEFTGQFGLNGIEAGLEGPISKSSGSSYLLNYRYSTLKLFDLIGISFGVSGIPQYQDLSYKFNFPTTKAGIFTFWGIGGMSKIAILSSEKDSADWSFTDSGEDLVFGSNMGATGLSHLYFFNDNFSGKFNLAVSGSQVKITIDTLSMDKNPYRIFTNNSAEKQVFANYTITNKLNAHHLIKAGVTCKNMLVDYHSEYWSKKYAQYLSELGAKDNAISMQSFVHWQYRITDNLMLNSGIHVNHFTLSNSTAIEPRVGIRWQFLPKQTLSASFGKHSQTLPLIYYFFNANDSASTAYSNTNRSLDMSKSTHYVLGYDYNFAQDFRLKLETYYQDQYNIPVEKYYSSSFSILNVGNELGGITLMDSLVNNGTGFNYGTEFTVEKFFSKTYYFLSSLSLYESKYKASDGVLRHTSFSGNYVYNLLGGVELPVGSKKNHLIALDLKLTFAGGNRYTPIDIQKSILHREAQYIDSLAFSKRFRDYQKVDLKISYRINRKKASHYIFFHVENLLNRKNILQQVYDESTHGIKEEYQLGIFPYGGYRIEF